MSNIKLTKERRILWDTATGETICEVHDTNPRSVTECWRDGVEAYESIMEYAILDKVETMKLKKAVLFRRVNEDGEFTLKDGTVVETDWTAKEIVVVEFEPKVIELTK